MRRPRVITWLIMRLRKQLPLIRCSAPQIGSKEILAASRVIRSGRLAAGCEAEKFESEFAAFVGVREAVAVSSGTQAVSMALLAAGVMPGDHVIVPPLTFFATIEAVIHAGAIPIFADVDLDTLCLDPASVENAVTNRTSAILAVHLYGHPAPMRELRAIARRNRLVLVEDAAQAHGAMLDGRMAGALADAGAFSFYATKSITTMEGGMVTTNSAGAARRLRCLRNHGMTDRDSHEEIGGNWRMNEVAAAIGRVQLHRFPALQKKRERNSHWLLEKLRAHPGIVPLSIRRDVRHAFFWAPFLVNNSILGLPTERLVGALKRRGIEVRHRYREPLYRQRALADLSGTRASRGRYPNYRRINLPNAENRAGRIIGLPNHPGITRSELSRIVSVMNEFGPVSEA